MNSSLDKERAKICILTSVHPPLDGRIFHKEAKSLLKAGYNVVLIAQHTREETIDGIRIVPLPKPKNRFERMTKVVWKLLKLALKEKAKVEFACMPVGALWEPFRQSGADVHVLPKGSWSNPLTWWKFYWILRELLRARRFDLMIVHTPAMSWIA